MSWVERAADRSPIVQRSRSRGMQQARAIVDAASRLVMTNGSGFTTQELVKEAGVALQTFYRYFASKDQLLLAVLEDMIGRSCLDYDKKARRLTGPVERLHFYVNTILAFAWTGGAERSTQQFITAEHWRLQRLYPEEIAEAIRPVVELILREVQAGVEAGLFQSTNPDYDAWLITQLLMGVYHHYAFAPIDQAGEEIAPRVWTFCLSALGGPARPAPLSS